MALPPRGSHLQLKCPRRGVAVPRVAAGRPRGADPRSATRTMPAPASVLRARTIPRPSPSKLARARARASSAAASSPTPVSSSTCPGKNCQTPSSVSRHRPARRVTRSRPPLSIRRKPPGKHARVSTAPRAERRRAVKVAGGNLGRDRVVPRSPSPHPGLVNLMRRDLGDLQLLHWDR